MGGDHHIADAVDLAVQLVILAVHEPLDNGFGPTLSTSELPLTLRSLIIVTLSPSDNRVPWASFTVKVSSASGSAEFHSWPHSGQMSRF